MKQHYKFYLSIVLSVLLILNLTGCNNEVEVKQDIKNVKVFTVSTSSLSVGVEYSAKLKPQEEIIISPKVSGKVLSVNADVGTQVKKGDTLFTIDPKDLNDQLKQAQASLDNAKSNLNRTQDSLFAQQLSQAEFAQKNAKVQYDQTKRYYDINVALYSAGAVAKREMDDMSDKLKNAEYQLNMANENVEILKSKVIPQSIDLANTQVKQAQTAVDLISSQISNTVITSPIDGVVSARNVDAGELVSSAVPAYTVVNTKTLYAEVSIPAISAVKLKQGQNVNLSISTLENTKYKASIETITPNADARTQLYTVKIKVDNLDDIIKPGLLTKVTFVEEEKRNVLTVLNDAIVIENGTRYLYIVKDSTVKKTAVNTGLSDGKFTEIISGANEGDNVITEGQSFINDGDKVNITK